MHGREISRTHGRLCPVANPSLVGLVIAPTRRGLGSCSDDRAIAIILGYL
jgi:hypothetical protein